MNIKNVYKYCDNPKPFATVEELRAYFEKRASLHEVGSSKRDYWQNKANELANLTDNDIVISYCFTSGRGISVNERLPLEELFMQSGFAYHTQRNGDAYWYNYYFIVHETNMRDAKNRIIFVDKKTNLPFVFKANWGSPECFSYFFIGEPK